MSRLLSISICLICTLATFADAQVEGLINPCATESYFYEKEDQWHLYIYELGKTKGIEGIHFEFGSPMDAFTVDAARLNDYAKVVNAAGDDHKKILPFRYFSQFIGRCVLTDEVRPMHKLLQELSSLTDEHTTCDSKLVVARHQDDWCLTCRGCSWMRLEDWIGEDQALGLKELARLTALDYDDADSLSFPMIFPNACGKEQ